MVSSIERLHYYERQFLRSRDLTAEQDYHIEMRRRLNLALHLHGIVDGLELNKGPTAPKLPDQVYVTAGLAIDRYGREIVRFQTFAIDEDVLADNRISTPGTYSVYVAYRRELGTPPAGGDRVCNASDQYTRWFETGRIFLSNAAQPTLEVPLTDPLPDDPEIAPAPVKLGSIIVAADSAGRLSATDVGPTKTSERTYIGLRAQRLLAPVASVTAPSNEKEKLLPIRSEADFRAAKNLIVGTDFDVDKSKVVPAVSEPPPFPGDAGNVRVERNLFLKGTLYQVQPDASWLALNDLVAKLCRDQIPEIKVLNQLEIPVSPASVSPPNNSIGLPAAVLTADVLAKPSKASVMVSLSGIEWLGKGELDTNWWNKLPANAPGLHVAVTVSSIQKKAGTDNQFEGDVSWSVSPTATNADPTKERLAIAKLYVNVIVIFSP